jgi:predicted ATPase
LITKVEATNFRCLKGISQTLRPFQVLVGPNSSGKSAFLDVIGFIGDLVTVGLKETVARRTENFHDLVWGRDGTSFDLAIEAQPPSDPKVDGNGARPKIRYVAGLRLDAKTDQVLIASERLTLRDQAGSERITLDRTTNRAEFPNEDGQGTQSLQLSPDVSGLPYIDDPANPSGAWLKTLLQRGLQSVVLDEKSLRAPSPPGRNQGRDYDGLNLARSVFQVSDTARVDFEAWIRHIRTAMPDVDTVKTVLRPEDRHRYLMVRYKNGIEVPSWMLSGGTLRLLALTLLAYMPDLHGVYMIEEPEVGVHPVAIETIVQSLSSVYSGQVLLTSHSPILLSLPEPRDLLCFQRTDQGTAIIPGDRHPLLQDWRSGVSISDLFAAGVLG